MRKIAIALLLACGVRADVVEFENGDRLTGVVLSLSGTELKLRNEVQGVITVPRAKIVSIHLKERAGVTGALGTVPGAGAAREKLKQQDETARAIEQVQNQFLAGATPEAQAMFQEMVSGLMSGKLQMGDIQAQARNSLRELRELEKDLGDDEMAGLLGSYAAILENFLRATPAGTNTLANPSIQRAPAPSGK